jgi:hypothetical protein
MEKKKERYLITEDDAYHIECLIEMLALAVWEILRDKSEDGPPDDKDEGCVSFVDKFAEECFDLTTEIPF